jgi:hypothetical protein
MTTTLPRAQSCGSAPASPAATEPLAGTTIAQDLALGQHARSWDSRFVGTSAEFRRGYLLADRIHELHEPWRTRFIELIAQRVNANVLAGRLPSRTQIAVWLSGKQLARLVGLMLRAWTCEDW